MKTEKFMVYCTINNVLNIVNFQEHFRKTVGSISQILMNDDKFLPSPHFNPLGKYSKSRRT